MVYTMVAILQGFSVPLAQSIKTAYCPLPNHEILGDPEVTASIYCKSRNLPNTDTQNHSTDLR